MYRDNPRVCAHDVPCVWCGVCVCGRVCHYCVCVCVRVCVCVCVGCDLLVGTFRVFISSTTGDRPPKGPVVQIFFSNHGL